MRESLGEMKWLRGWIVLSTTALTLFAHDGLAKEKYHPVLWPKNSVLLTEPHDAVDLVSRAKKLLNTSPKPIVELHSAGVKEADDPRLLATRESIQDTDRVGVLSLAYAITKDERYLDKAREFLLAWATTNQPTGHPIDETRLDKMIWGYDLIASQLAKDDREVITAWFTAMREKKRAWPFGKETMVNNHRTHQLKMLLLLDKILHDKVSEEQDVAAIQAHLQNNIDDLSGMTIDYKQRHALHYQNYDLQPWLEIDLILGELTEPVDLAFKFLHDCIKEHRIHGEFQGSSAPIDKARAEGGFAYAKTGGDFDVAKAAPTIVVYYALISRDPPPELSAIVKQAKSSAELTFLQARSLLRQMKPDHHLELKPK